VAGGAGPALAGRDRRPHRPAGTAADVRPAKASTSTCRGCCSLRQSHAAAYCAACACTHRRTAWPRELDTALAAAIAGKRRRTPRPDPQHRPQHRRAPVRTHRPRAWQPRHGHAPITLRFRGSAGQSFGAFNAGGLQLELEGEANDYVGKGMAGGRMVVRPPRGSRFASQARTDPRQHLPVRRHRWRAVRRGPRRRALRGAQLRRDWR
jgi:hypothetical protein